MMISSTVTNGAENIPGGSHRRETSSKVLTTYLTPTSGGADGNNGEIGLKTSRKWTKWARKRPKTGIGKLGVCLGAGRREFESRHSDHKTAENGLKSPVSGLFFCAFCC